MADWSSGWLPGVANGHTHVLTHNLGTTDVNFRTYISLDAAGAGHVQEAFFNASFVSSTAGTAYGGRITSISDTQVTFQQANEGWFIMNTNGGAGSVGNFATSWIKIIGTSSGGGALPIATENDLGGVKVGDGLSITQDGVLSADDVPGMGDLCKLSTEEGGGYQMFRNGLTMQWVSSDPLTTAGVVVINFEKPFASTPFKVTASTRYPSGDPFSQQLIQVMSWDANGVTVFAQSLGGDFKPIIADIFAIGISEVTDCPGSTDSGDLDGTKISLLESTSQLKNNDLFVISKENTGDQVYDISQKVTLEDLATFIKGASPTPTPTPDGVVHFSSKIISNAANDTDSKAFVVDPWSDITAVGVYEIQSTYAFKFAPSEEFTTLDPDRTGDGWTNSTGLGKAVPVVAKQDLKSMAIPAGATVKFSLDWTHLGATYVHHTYSREDLIFFEIIGPALIVDLSPGEEPPDASAGTHLASVGITEATVYNWYDILQYPAYGGLNSPRAIFDQGTLLQFADDLNEAVDTNVNINNLYVNLPADGDFNPPAIGRWPEVVINQLIFGAFLSQDAIDGLFKLPATSAVSGDPIDQRTLRNMPYTSTLIIE